MKTFKLTTICFSLISIGLISSCASKNSLNGMVARMEVKEPIEGVCDNSNVIAILPIPVMDKFKLKLPRQMRRFQKILTPTLVT